MMAQRRDPGRDAAIAISHRQVPEVEAMLEALRLPKDLAAVAEGQGSTSLDHGWFAFGRLYRVKKDLKANRAGRLAKGDYVRFLGAYVFPYDNGLRLHFEPEDQAGKHVVLEFEGNFPVTNGVVRMIDANNAGEFFSVSPSELDRSRRAELLQAETMLLDVRAQTDTLRYAAIEAAKPAYHREYEAFVAEHRQLGHAVHDYVLGDSDILTETHLDYGALRYGHAYRVTRAVAANRSGALVQGETVIFRGAEMRFGEELTLDFIREDGSNCELVFYPSDRARCPELAALSSFVQELPEGSSACSTRLIQARAILDDLRLKREASL